MKVLLCSDNQLTDENDVPVLRGVRHDWYWNPMIDGNHRKETNLLLPILVGIYAYRVRSLLCRHKAKVILRILIDFTKGEI
jgi:hypothetical protein